MSPLSWRAALTLTLATLSEPAPRVAIVGIGHELRGDDAAGLLVRKGRKPWLLKYGAKGLRPYSSQGARRFEP